MAWNDVARQIVSDVRVVLANGYTAPTARELASQTRRPASYAAEIERLWTLAHASDFAGLAVDLPRLLSSAQTDAKVDQSPSRLRDLADAYQLAAAVTTALGWTDVAWLCADRAVAVAKENEDVQRMAAGYVRFGHVLLREGNNGDAGRLADLGIGWVIGDDDPECIALHGALTLIVAIAYARGGDREAAEKRLRIAEKLAPKAARNVAHTEFGPVNVRLHAVAVYVELGLPEEALKAAEGIDDASLSAERRSRLLVDVARAHHQQREYHKLAAALEKAFALAPQGVARNLHVGEILDALDRLGDATPEETRATIAKIRAQSRSQASSSSP